MKKQRRKVGDGRLPLKAKRWVLSAVIMAGGGWEVQADTATTDLSANQPINISGVLNYGYSAMIANQIFNTNEGLTGQNGTNYFNNFDFNWSYYNSCPNQVWDANRSKCECRDAGQTGQSMSAGLSFGYSNPLNYSTSNIAGNSEYQPANDISYIVQNLSSGALAINPDYVNNPNTLYGTPQGSKLLPGDIIYSMFSGFVMGNSSGPSLTVGSPQIYSIWNVTGSGKYTPPLNGCTYHLSASVLTNEYGGYVNNFMIEGAAFPIVFNTESDASPNYTVSSGNINIASPNPGSTSGLTLSSDNGEEESVWTPESPVGTDPVGYVPILASEDAPGIPASTNPPDGMSSSFCYTAPDNASNTGEEYQVGASATQQTIQTIQQGVTTENNQTDSWNVGVSLGYTSEFKANQGVASESETISAEFTAGYEQSMSNTKTVSYTDTSETSESSTVDVVNKISIAGGTATTSASTVTPPSGSGMTGQGSSSDALSGGSSYYWVWTLDNGAVYIDASNQITLQSNGYGTLPFAINGKYLSLNPGISQLVNLANNYNWVASVQGFGGNGAPSSNQLVANSNGTVTANGAVQLQSAVNSNMTLQLYETSSCASTAQSTTASVKNRDSKASGLKTGVPDHAFQWVASAELVDKNYIGFAAGKGFTPRLKNGRGFHLNRKDDGDSKYYVGSSGADNIRMGKGHDKVVAGHGNDIVHGGEGHDRIAAGRGKNSIYGDEGNDLLYGGPETDALLGGPGDDQLAGLGGFDQYDPGEGVDSIFMDVDAKNHVDNLELKDKINIGKYATDNNGRLIRKANYTANHKLVESSLTGFARIVDKKSGKVLGMVRGKNGFFAANPTRWAEMALVNKALLPARLFKTDAAGLDVPALGKNAKEWYFNEGFKKGFSTYRYENLNELKADKKAFRVWLKRIVGAYGKKAIGNQSIDGIIVSANEYDSATKLIRDFILK